MRLLILFFASVSSFLQPKFCTNCKHFIPDMFVYEFGTCSKFPVNKIIYTKSGPKIYEEVTYEYCSDARFIESMCGKNAKFYEKD
jgi:hypothetical protein